MPKPNRLERFENKVINRKQIKNAPYNPRKISESARKNLRALIRTHKLLAPISWNETTGHIIGGHQRLAAMDIILKKDDYNLTVSASEMDLDEEVKANIGMNNPSSMGEWDTNALAEVHIEFPEIDFEKDLKFDKFDLDIIFADSELEDDIFQEEKEEIVDELDRLREIDRIKAAKKAHRDKAHAENKEGGSHQLEDDDYMVTVVFPNNSEKHDFMKHINEKADERYIRHTKIYDIQDGKLKAYGK